ncbi:hypothetical protein BpHYR1_002871 [Brachionus plicatilis]|uniref:Uncharacterized protein n=1 Tax=Brachionus plicatilis TaxID=10195 RepID=A0A3M7PF54_BRAPC|nr:hypothetical protein BpHYR1_002871 [Brachionus plicatilis]
MDNLSKFCSFFIIYYNTDLFEWFYQNLREFTKILSKICWAAAKPGRSERGQNKAARPKTDGHFGGQTKSANKFLNEKYSKSILKK